MWRFKTFRWITYAGFPPFQFDPAAVGRGWANTPMTPGSKATPWPLESIDERESERD